MSEQEERSKEYKRVRDTFDKLSLDEKASFLVEAVFSTVSRGIERASETVSEELNTLFEQAQRGAEGHGPKPEGDARSKDGAKPKKPKRPSAAKAKRSKTKASSRKKTGGKSKKTSSS